MKLFLSTLSVCVALATASHALVPLERNPTVVNGFYAIGLADEIRKNCPSISPRWMRAYAALKSLESYARKAGYSDTQIEALTKNKTAKSQLRARIRADLATRGATPGKSDVYCAIGRAEIANGTAAGRLITE